MDLGGTAHSPEDVVKLHRLGLQFAEIPIIDPKKFLDLTDEYRGLRDKLGLYYLCHGPREGDPNNPETLEKVYLPRLMKILSIMPRLGMKLLTIHLWVDPRYVTPELISYKTGFLKRVLERAEEADVRVCLENMSETAEHMAPVLDALPSLSLTLDLGHAELLTERNTSFGFIDKFPQRIGHIHLHDNLGGDSPVHDLHLPPGKGKIDLSGILCKLYESGYGGTMTLELRPEEIRDNLDRVIHLLRVSGFRTRAKRSRPVSKRKAR